MAYEPDGSLLVCEQVSSSLVRIRPDGLREVVAFHYQGKYLNSPNDVIVRSDGTIYFTDPNYGRWDVPVGVGRKCELDFQGLFMVPPGGGDVTERPEEMQAAPRARAAVSMRFTVPRRSPAPNGRVPASALIHAGMSTRVRSVTLISYTFPEAAGRAPTRGLRCKLWPYTISSADNAPNHGAATTRYAR